MSFRGVLIGYLIFVILAFILYFNWQILTPLSSKEINLQPFEIKKGQSLQEIALELKEKKLIRNEKLFQIVSFLLNVRKKFYPGLYYLSPKMNLITIIKTLTNPKNLEEREITIIEGWSSKEIADYLDKEGIIKKEIFLKEVNELEKYISEFDFLKEIPQKANLEGFLFPDTYRIYKNTTAEAIIKKMLRNFSLKVTPELRNEIKNQKKTLYDVVILASLVEKEAADEVERRLIADIFWRRLENQIPLQSCASINYILGTSKRQLSFEETRVPSPFNTYINKGLPPQPINNPSLSSIKAVIYPLKNDYWYFLATKEGKTIFSRTKEEHDKNKAIYLK
jgi:UPF0755 protein